MLPLLPIHFDLFAVLILLGEVQGLFLSFFFLTSKQGNPLAHRCLGFMILACVFAINEVFFSYTNLIQHAWWLVDAAEPVNYVLAPLSYLYISTSLTGRFKKRQWWHFAPFFVYLVYVSVVFYPQSDLVKFNAFRGSYHPEMPEMDIEYYGKWWWFEPKRWVNEAMLVQMLVYIVLSFRLIYRYFQQENLPFFSNQDRRLAWCRHQAFLFLTIIVVFVVIKLSFVHDLGDHLIAGHISFIIYAIMFSVIRRSVFFQETTERTPRKYEKSSLTTELQEATIKKLKVIMETEKPFLQADFSLPMLAKQLGVSTHHLSQVLNEQLRQSFFDLVASYRVVEAKQLLCSKPPLKIEEIAEMVGYNSKSSFNTTFKKLTGKTPSEYRSGERTMLSE